MTSAWWQLLCAWLAFRLAPWDEYRGQAFMRCVERLRLELTREYWKLTNNQQ